MRRFAILLAVLAGCSHSATSDAGSTPADAGPFCEALAEAECAYEARCGASVLSASQCAAFVIAATPDCALGLLASGEVVPASNANDCVAAIGASSCSGASIASANAICGSGSLFVGNVELGAACQADRSCIGYDGGNGIGCFRGFASSTCGGVCSAGQPLGAACERYVGGGDCAEGYCFGEDAGQPGVCAPFLALDGGCAGFGCAPDAFCDSTSQRCTARFAAGQSCTNDQCAQGLHCGDGACRATAADGAACDANDYQSCAYPDVCLNGVCAKGYVGVGEACNAQVQCVDAFCSAVDGGGVCVDPPGVGEPCTVGCASNFSCSSGTCAAHAGLGQPCSGDCGVGLWCSHGVCAALALPGMPCVNTQCLGGFCDDAGTCTAFEPPFGPCTDDSQCGAVFDAHLCHAPSDGGIGFCATCDLDP